MDQCWCSGSYRTPTYTSHQGSSITGIRIQHHQYQDAQISGINHIRNILAKIPHVREWQTRRVPTDNEGLWDRSWWDRNCVCYQKIQFLRIMLRRETIRELKVLSIQVWSTTNGHIKLIKDGFLEYFLPIKSPNKLKRAMRCAMRKPWYILFKIFSAWLMELNNYVLLLPGSSTTKNMDPEELNKILIHSVSNSCSKRSYIKGWNFEGRS